MPRLNPKQIRAKKVADSVRKAMKTGGKKRPPAVTLEQAAVRVGNALDRSRNP